MILYLSYVTYLNFELLVFVQGNREGGRAKQPAANESRDAVHGSRRTLYAEEEAETSSAREPRSAGGRLQGSQPGDPRVPVPVQKPKVELFHAQLSQRKEPFRKNCRQR